MTKVTWGQGSGCRMDLLPKPPESAQQQRMSSCEETVVPVSLTSGSLLDQPDLLGKSTGIVSREE